MLEYKGEKHDSMHYMEVRWAAVVRFRQRSDALDRARALLQQIEWIAGPVDWNCPACGGVKPVHRYGCGLEPLIA